ncbi:MAG: hypothetical protein K5765_01440 [Clostridia bacterium]|nr:hypothetical protein [Clostridia bacterium]
MNKKDAISLLKGYIKKSYSAINEKIGPNIFRGHLQSLSVNIENGIALFVSNILPDNKIFLDPSIHIDGKNNRPDLLVVNEAKEVVAMIEIKANMGWCRNAKGVIDDMLLNNDKYIKEESLYCEFSREESQSVTYSDKVKLFLIALTDGNCNEKYHKANKEYAKANNVFQFNLFSGWYGELTDCEIEQFADELLK